MNRLLAWILLGAMLLSLCACGGAAAPVQTEAVEAEDPAVPETTAVSAQPEAAAPAATEPAIEEGNLFLKVSAITFSTVGESDDIYLGLVPRELVTWESDDPNVVSVENGVLTATGVGTTTIRATYYDRQAECTAGCLAATEEELKALDKNVLNTPKRIPPVVDMEETCTYFDNAAIVGDSITYIMSQHESKTNYLGGITFLARGGVSMNGFVRHYKNLYFRGKEMYLEKAIAESGVERVYFLMGSNDVGDSANRAQVFDNWAIIVDRIRQLHPTVELVLLSNIPLYDTTQYSDDDNDRIEEYNRKLRQFADENGCLFLDLAYYVQDHNERMPKMYSMDDYHLNETGCILWMGILRYYAQFESEGGILP